MAVSHPAAIITRLLLETSNLTRPYPPIMNQLTCALWLCLTSLCLANTNNHLLIWDNQAAKKWDHAYPVGNGVIGAMPMGQFPTEKILINEETIWENQGEMKMAKGTFKQLETIRELEARGKYAEADRHFEKHILDGKRPNSYQLVGWLNLEYPENAKLSSTRRELDLNTGVARTVFTLNNGNRITQEVIASSPDAVVAVQI
ncbi:MAG: glycoside hydrolase family 95 protein, partial [Verrucomicrobiae bacterium]|nr:glycoside hydrolase family 95 protein [Verrucomicrobiae bacterium]NNJ86964.1 hypothetical protein [Akkermansiaceae bacterium]